MNEQDVKNAIREMAESIYKVGAKPYEVIAQWPDNTPTLETNHLRLKEISNGNNGGAQPFEPGLIAFVLDIISGLSVQPMIFPTESGSVLLQYGVTKHLILEFFPDFSIKMYEAIDGVKSLKSSVNPSDLNKVIEVFLAAQNVK